MMAKIASALHALHMTMTYRKDILELYKNFAAFAEDIYKDNPIFVGKRRAVTAVTLPNRVTFAKEKDYRSGFKTMGSEEA